MTNEAFQQAIINRIHEKGIALPTLPDVAFKVKSIAENPNSTASDLASVVSRDPAISARLIQVANSPLYRGVQPIENLNQIITRIGMRAVSNLVVSLALQQLFQSKSQALQQRMPRHWEFSTQVATLATMLARKHRHIDPEQAMLAGLLHGIGALPVIAIAEDIPKLQAAPALLDELILELQPRLGVQIISAWNFPEHFTTVVRECGNLQRTHEGPPDYTDVVTVAILQARSIDSGAADENWIGVPAAEKLGVDPTSNPLDDELEETFRTLTEGL